MKENKKSVVYYAIYKGVHSYVGTKPDEKADRSSICASFGHAKRKVVENLMWEAEILESLIQETIRLRESDVK